MSDAKWSPIDTAPKAFEYDITTPAGRIRGGDVIKVRGTHEGETAEFFVHWSQFGEEPPHWFVFDAAPLDWPAEEWRHLTAEEELELYGEAPDGIEECVACGVPFKAGDMVLSEESGGEMHVGCCGSERDSYVGPGGEPLKDGEPIPTGRPWEPTLSSPAVAVE